MIFADATGDAPQWASLIGSVVNIGFAGVIGWYLLTRALPKMQDDFRTELRAEREDNVLRRREAATEHKDALGAIVAHYERETAKDVDLRKVELTLLTKSVQDVAEVMEQVRDALKSLEQEIRANKR